MRISDWSSDVCSSDLEARYAVVLNHEVGKQAAIRVGAHAVEGSFGNRRRKAIRFFALYININQFVGDRQRGPIEVMYPAVAQPYGVADGRFIDRERYHRTALQHEIGRASCRESVCQYV